MKPNNLNKNQHISVLKRLSGGTTRQQHQGRTSNVSDARELLIKKNVFKKSPRLSFDARQLIQKRTRAAAAAFTTTIPFLNQQVSLEKDPMVVVTGLKDIRMRGGKMVSSLDPTKSKKIFNVGPSTFVTIRNNPTSSPSLLTKTFSNNLAQMDTDDYSDDEIKRRHDNDGLSSLSDQKVVVSVVNDLYKKVVKPTAISSSTTTTTSSSLITSTRKDRARLPVQRELPVKRQHNDASIQTTARATSPPQHQKHRGIRSPIRRTKISTSTTTHDMDEDFDTVEHIESPPPKRTQSHSTQQHQQSSYLVRKTVQQTSNDQSTMKRTMATTVSSATTPTRIGRSTATVEKQNMVHKCSSEN
ncbi:unnamed protein product, partial [Didymodactylos carnosus]